MNWSELLAAYDNQAIAVPDGLRTVLERNLIPLNGTYMHVVTNLLVYPDFDGLTPKEVAVKRRELRETFTLVDRYMQVLLADEQLRKTHTSGAVLHEDPVAIIMQVLKERE